jgi:hypothetical protein
MKRWVTLFAFWLAPLSATLAAGFSANCIQSINIGQTINGQLTTGDCSWYYTSTPQHLYYTDVYAFSGTAGQQISATLSSPTLDMYLEIYNVNDFAAAPVAADDNGGGGYNARIPASSGYFTLPSTGTYYIWAQTADPNWTGNYALTLSGSSVPTPGTPAETTVYEFYHPQTQHYFITAYADEIALLSSGKIPPWVATGQSFKVWSGAGTNIVPVCRFYTDKFASKPSHFYSSVPQECPGLANGGVWTLEAPNAFYLMSASSGSCPSGTMPLYRIYNNVLSGAPNHRYTTQTSIRSSMVASGWTSEGYGADLVFACVPYVNTPPPSASAFQTEVTGYANTVLSLVNGNTLDMDKLTVILGASLAALETPTSTCPVATSNPPLAGLTTFPPNLTINANFGNGCTVGKGTAAAFVSGSVVINVSNLVFTQSSIAGTFGVTMNNVKVNGTLVANGTAQASVAISVNSSTSAYSGTVNATLTNFTTANGLGASGTASINLNSTGTTLLTTDLVTTPQNLAVKLNASIATSGNGVVVNTTGTSTVGAYTVAVANLRIDTDVCANAPYAGSIAFSKGGQTGTLAFNSGCTYTYSGP